MRNGKLFNNNDRKNNECGDSAGRLSLFSRASLCLWFICVIVATSPAQITVTPISSSNRPCGYTSPNQSIMFCNPWNGSTISSPVHIVATAKDSNSVTQMQLLIDGLQIFQNASSFVLNAYVGGLTSGAHSFTVRASDSAGVIFQKSMSLTITNHAGLSNIKHIIFLVQENRSQDNYFGRMGDYRANKGFNDYFDGLPLSRQLKDKAGALISPYPFQTVCHENLSPGWDTSHYNYDGSKMDNFMRAPTNIGSTIDPNLTRALGYYDWTDLPYYYELAFQFATTDRFFSSTLTGTISNRMYLFAGTSFGHINPDTPPSGGWPQGTIFDHLDLAGISWRYYYQDNSVYLAQWSTWSRDASRVYSVSHWYTDLQHESTLPQVIFIERASQLHLDEHPGYNIQSGSANTKKIIDALMNSPSWGSSVLLLTFDEAGGLYDHVPPVNMIKPDNIPPILGTTDLAGDFGQTGFRVPFVLISPWVRPHFVSHTWRDLTSILRLIEVRFGVMPLTLRDSTADDMMEFFDFSSPHLQIPPPLPDQPTTGTCAYSLEKAPGQ